MRDKRHFTWAACVVWEDIGAVGTDAGRVRVCTGYPGCAFLLQEQR